MDLREIFFLKSARGVGAAMHLWMTHDRDIELVGILPRPMGWIHHVDLAIREGSLVPDFGQHSLCITAEPTIRSGEEGDTAGVQKSR